MKWVVPPQRALLPPASRPELTNPDAEEEDEEEKEDWEEAGTGDWKGCVGVSCGVSGKVWELQGNICSTSTVQRHPINCTPNSPTPPGVPRAGPSAKVPDCGVLRVGSVDSGFQGGVSAWVLVESSRDRWQKQTEPHATPH